MAAHPASTDPSHSEKADNRIVMSEDDLAEFDKLLNDLQAQTFAPDGHSLSLIYQRLRFINLRLHGA